MSEFREKAELMDGSAVMRTVRRMAHEIIEKNKGTENMVLVGIRRRGMPLAELIRDAICSIEGVRLPCGELDIRFYRDDLERESEEPSVMRAKLPFDVNGKKVVLVDDVLYTGRTARCAIDAIFSLGRPDAIRLAILVDRGHRELPIRADYVGKNVPTSKSELVSVSVPEYDGELSVRIMEEVK